MSTPYFSIVIPCYNRTDSILPTLLSVKGQAFGGYECIVVDDGSDDGEELRRVVEGLHDARFQYLRRVNGGGSATRNTGIDAATGKFVAFLDSDDIWLNHKLANDYTITLRELKTRTVLFRPVVVDRGIGKTWVKPHRGPRQDENISEYLACNGGFVQTSTLVMPTEVARRVRFAEGLPFGQDTDFAIRLAADGQRFLMAETPSVIFSDFHSSGRVSQKAQYLPMLEWTDRVRSILTPKAYFAYRGWHVARLAAPFDIRLAFKLYFQGLFCGAMSPRVAAIAFAQIIFPRALYRKFADSFVSTFGSTQRQ
jgi:glycosyltransferase involved in cell wall biosynthesis